MKKPRRLSQFRVLINKVTNMKRLNSQKLEMEEIYSSDLNPSTKKGN
jgi:hypothetical protein